MTRLDGRWLERPWGRMRVWNAGDGPTLLAIHGLGGSGRYWDGLAKRLGDGYTVIAPDLGGFGASDKPPLDYDRGFHLANLDAVVERHAPSGPLIVVGHSLGGVLAALWSGLHADRVHALVLAATPFPTGQGMQVLRESDLPIVRRLAARAIRAAWPLVGVPVGIARGYPAGIAADFGRATILSRVWTMQSLLYDPAICDDLMIVGGLAHARTLLLYAADDTRIRPESQTLWTEILPHAEREVVPSGGHQFLLRDGFEAMARWLDVVREPD